MLALCEDWALLVICSRGEKWAFPAFWPGLSGHRGLRVSMSHGLQERELDEGDGLVSDLQSFWEDEDL